MNDRGNSIVPEDAHSVGEAERFQLLVDAVQDHAIYMIDPHGVVTNWNSGARAHQGLHADEIVGQHISRFYTREDRAAGLPGRVLETAPRGPDIEAEGWRVRKDGTRFWAAVVIDAIRDPDGELIGFAKITRDITERRGPASAARERASVPPAGQRRHRLRALHAGPERHRHQLERRGRAHQGLHGRRNHRPAFLAILHRRGSRGRACRRARSQTAAREGRFEAEGWRVRKDGSLFWANVVIDPIRDEDGELLGFAKITRDITERREAQMAIEKTQAQLAQIAEDGGARAAHRRRRARFQQPADGGQRLHPDDQAAARARSEGPRARGSHRACRAARRRR